MPSLILRTGEIVLFDDEDAPLVLSRTWGRCSGKAKHGSLFYARHSERQNINGTVRKIQTTMHRLLLGFPFEVIDHINGNGLDNRRSNLRTVSHSQNRQNAANYGKFLKGVHKRRNRNRNGYYAMINGKYIGSYNTEIEAALAYDTAAKQFFGEFARLNFPDGVPYHLMGDTAQLLPGASIPPIVFHDQWKHVRGDDEYPQEGGV